MASAATFGIVKLEWRPLARIRNYSRNFTCLIPRTYSEPFVTRSALEILMSKNPVLIAFVVCILLLSSLAQVQTVQPTSQVPVTAGALTGPMLEDGTPIKLRIARTVSSADAHVGDTVDFEVLEEVHVGNLLVIPKGGTAWATVTEAQSKRRMARGGKLDMNIDSVRLVDGERLR
jgi:hypothetical protein